MSAPKEQAKALVATAQRNASRIRAKARDGAVRARATARVVRERTKETVVHARESAIVATEHAVRLFRINLANTLTLFNAVFGFLSMLAAIQGQFLLAAAFILLGVLCDWLDGKAARAFGEESPLGRELDSLSDLVTFGVAPAILVVLIEPGFLAYFAGGLFVLSAALRLGRFNVQHEKGVFFGVPTTTNGVVLPLMIFLGAPTSWFPVYLLLLALLMNAPLKLKKIL